MHIFVASAKMIRLTLFQVMLLYGLSKPQDWITFRLVYHHVILNNTLSMIDIRAHLSHTESCRPFNMSPTANLRLFPSQTMWVRHSAWSGWGTQLDRPHLAFIYKLHRSKVHHFPSPIITYSLSIAIAQGLGSMTIISIWKKLRTYKYTSYIIQPLVNKGEWYM